MKKHLPNILATIIIVGIILIGFNAKAEFDTRDLCLRAKTIIENNGTLEDINSEASKYLFKQSGNGITQAIYTKFFTLPGLCIITLKSGLPVNAKFHPNT